MSKFPPPVVARLLDALSGDDDFRARFVEDPRAALEGLDWKTPPADFGIEGRDPVLPFYDLGGGLASKETIARGRERLERAYNEATVTGSRGVIFGTQDFCAG